jgi:hypothetical protein
MVDLPLIESVLSVDLNERQWNGNSVAGRGASVSRLFCRASRAQSIGYQGMTAAGDATAARLDYAVMIALARLSLTCRFRTN